jgi:hypothetical protein
MWNGNECVKNYGKENMVTKISTGPSPLKIIIHQKQLKNVSELNLEAACFKSCPEVYSYRFSCHSR